MDFDDNGLLHLSTGISLVKSSSELLRASARPPSEGQRPFQALNARGGTHYRFQKAASKGGGVPVQWTGEH